MEAYRFAPPADLDQDPAVADPVDRAVADPAVVVRADRVEADLGRVKMNIANCKLQIDWTWTRCEDQ
jgi:hypothetical protein